MKQGLWVDQVREYLEAVEQEMRACLPATGDLILDPFYGMMAYHLGWRDASFRPANERTGKRLRPLLCLLACEASGADWQQALPVAAAVELLHNFTLIHDDIEDGSAVRRGRPTVWNLWGVPQAINAGDGLFVLARAALLRLRQQSLPDDVILQAVNVLDLTILRICEGQYLDLSFEGRLDVDEVAYTGMIARKTATLLDAAVHLGALVARAPDDMVTTWRSFGHALGLAFQIEDDRLGVWGEEAATGKPAAADIHGRKLGLPLVHALAHADVSDRDLLSQVYGRDGPIDEAAVEAVLRALARTGSRSYVERRAAEYHRKALDALLSLPKNSARDMIEEIARSLVGRRS